MNEKPIELGDIIKNPSYILVKIIGEELPDQKVIESLLSLVGIPPESYVGPFCLDENYLLIDRTKFEGEKVRREIERLSHGY